MKPEPLVACPSKRSRSKQFYALCVSVDYPGDFALSGRHWRVVTGTMARSAEEAYKSFESVSIKGPYAKHMTTTYDPALDVLDARRVLRS
jgi:hypothetical protein